MRRFARQAVSVEIKNGKGEYLYAGPAGKIAVHPELAMLDGTLSISTLWSSGAVTQQIVYHVPHTPVDIGWDDPGQKYQLLEGGVPAPPSYRTHVRIADGAGKIMFNGSPDELEN